MGKSLVPRDAYAIMNLLVKEATGQNTTIQAVDSSTFVSAGETVLSTGTENTLNSLSRVLGRTLVSSRPYNARLAIINAMNSGLFSERIRKISYYSRDARPSGMFNTDLYNQHGAGMDNGVNRRVWNGSAIPIAGVNGSILPTGGLPNQWEQCPPVPLEMNFASRDVWDSCNTVYETQLQMAFRDEASFSQFVGGIMTELGNDFESRREAFNRMQILNFIATIKDMNNPGSVIDLKAAFNTRYGTNYSTAQLLSTYRVEFYKFFVSQYKLASDRMTERTAKFHWSPTKTVNGVSYTLLRHTPKDRQRALLYAPFFLESEATVMSGIFSPEYLDVGQYEKVTYWQNSNDPSAIDVTPAIPNTSNPASQTTGDRVQLDTVLGLLYDEDAIMTDFQLDSAYSTSLEARKGYRNVWYHVSRGAIQDATENAILFYMGNDA